VKKEGEGFYRKNKLGARKPRERSKNQQCTLCEGAAFRKMPILFSLLKEWSIDHFPRLFDGLVEVTLPTR